MAYRRRSVGSSVKGRYNNEYSRSRSAGRGVWKRDTRSTKKYYEVSVLGRTIESGSYLPALKDVAREMGGVVCDVATGKCWYPKSGVWC